MRLNPFGRRTDEPSDPAPQAMAERDIWWVRATLNVGRPLVGVAVLAMCAPGEHLLARTAGFPRVYPFGQFSLDLAWGMPFVLTAYAGIAAVVATKRPKGAPGKMTAVVGAALSVWLAMAAQPIAHLWGRGDLTAALVVLTCIVSCIPAGVFGHMLHMAAVPGERVRPSAGQDEPSVRDEDSQDNALGRHLRDTTFQSPLPDVLLAGRTERGKSVPDIQVEIQGTLSEADARSMSDLFDVPAVREDRPTDNEGFTTWHGMSGDSMSWTAAEADNDLDTVEAADRRARDNRLSALEQFIGDTPEEPEVVLSGAPTLVRNRVAETLLSGSQASAEDVRPHAIVRPVSAPDGEIRPIDVVRRLRSVYPAMSESDIKKRVREELPDAKQDSIRKAVSRTRDEA